MSITLDESRRPIIVVTVFGPSSEASFQAYLRACENVLARGERFVAIIDASKARHTPPRRRAETAEWLNAHDAEIRRLVIGTAFVIRSTIVRAALTTIFWVQPPSTPHVVVPTLAHADQWCREVLSLAAV